MYPLLTDYACVALIGVLREFAWGYMLLFCPKAGGFKQLVGLESFDSQGVVDVGGAEEIELVAD